jgi:hypothetical protein
MPCEVEGYTEHKLTIERVNQRLEDHVQEQPPVANQLVGAVQTYIYIFAISAIEHGLDIQELRLAAEDPSIHLLVWSVNLMARVGKLLQHKHLGIREIV